MSTDNFYKCLVCSKKADLVCSKCKTARYCSKECQTMNWPDHFKGGTCARNLELRGTNKYYAFVPEPDGRIFVRALQDIHAGTCVSYDTSYMTIAESQFAEAFADPKNAKMVVGAIEMATRLKIDGSDLTKFTEVFTRMSLPRFDPTKNEFRYEVYDRDSGMFYHSCNPNLHRAYSNRSNVVCFVTTQNIRKGGELRISYIPDWFLPKKLRTTVLKDNCGFICKCDACQSDSAEPERTEFLETYQKFNNYLLELNALGETLAYSDSVRSRGFINYQLLKGIVGMCLPLAYTIAGESMWNPLVYRVLSEVLPLLAMCTDPRAKADAHKTAGITIQLADSLQESQTDFYATLYAIQRGCSGSNS